MTQYSKLRQRALDMGTTKLEAARLEIRPSKERKATQHLRAAYRKNFDSRLLTQSLEDVANLLGEVAESVSMRQKLQRLRQKEHGQSPEKERGQER